MREQGGWGHSASAIMPVRHAMSGVIQEGQRTAAAKPPIPTAPPSPENCFAEDTRHADENKLMRLRHSGMGSVAAMGAMPPRRPRRVTGQASVWRHARVQ